jgi:phage shock protein A
MSINLKNFLELYVPKAGDERKFVAKHVVKKTPDANKNDDKLFTASNVKAIDRKKDNHGYNPGDDEKVYEEVEQIAEMDARTAKELATKSMKQGQSKKATMYNKVAAALERGDNTTAKGFLQQINNLDEASLTPGEMKKREDYVKGMKKNISSFKDRYGKDAKSVMYATATKMAKEEVEQIDELSKDTMKSYVKGAAQDLPRLGNTLGRVQTGALKDNKRIQKSISDKITNRYIGINKATDKLTKEDVDGLLLLSLYMSLDEDNQQEMLKMIDEGNKPELIEFAQSIME